MLKHRWQDHDFQNLDIKAGLFTAMGNEKLFGELLGRFLYSTLEYEQNLSDAFAKNDRKNGRIYAHSLKGLAANIGAKKLQNLAMELEKELSLENPLWPQSLQEACFIEAQTIREELTPFLEQEKILTCNREKTQELVQQLTKELSQSNPQACESAQELYACCSEGVMAKEYAVLLEKVLHYDFVEAQKLLNEIQNIDKKERTVETMFNQKSRKRFRILVIDDLADNIVLMNNILKDEYDIVVANSGIAGLELAKKEPKVDLILLDIIMPHLDGYALCKLLKAEAFTKDIPVIFLTVLDEISDIEKGFIAGGVDYVTKPFEPSILKARVKTHCELASQRVELKRFNNSLEMMVVERTKELEAAQLHAERLARQAALGDVISMIAHQWKQPLSIIAMVVNGVIVNNELEKVTKENLNDDMQKITQQITYLSRTIDDFRSFFKPKEEKQKLNIDLFCQTLTALVEPILKHYRIDFQLFIETREIYTYKNELLQVLINLINNAKDAIAGRNIEDGKIELKIYTNEFQKVIFEVSDNAGGIDEAIFPTLAQAYVSTKEDDEARGLGLYMSQMIAKKHLGGELTWENIQKGAKFTLMI